MFVMSQIYVIYGTVNFVCVAKMSCHICVIKVLKIANIICQLRVIVHAVRCISFVFLHVH